MDCLTQHTMDYQIVSIECDLDTLSMPWKCVLYLPRAINSLVLSYSDAFRYRLAGVIDPTKPGDLIQRELNEVILVCRKIAKSNQTSDEIARLVVVQMELKNHLFNRLEIQ